MQLKIMTANKGSLKYSLASKKKPAPKLKNVLAQPLPRYWPEINEDDRTELKKELQQTLDGENKPQSSLSLGMSSCLRLLKRNEVACLLLSGEIKPKHIITQIIFSVINKSETIPVLVVPELKKLTEEIFKISSLTVAIAKESESNLVHWIRKKAEDFPIPDRLLNYYGTAKTSKTASSLQFGQQGEKNEPKPALEEVVFANFYLPRDSSGCRAFIPANAAQGKSGPDANKWSDYISLSNKPSSVEPMEVDTEPVKKEEMSLKDLLQKSTKLQRQKNLQKSSKPQKESSKVDVPNGTACKTTVDAVERPKIKLKKKKKQVSSEDKPKQVVNYVSLKVNKIQGNPDKVKKKKNKNKK